MAVIFQIRQDGHLVFVYLGNLHKEMERTIDKDGLDMPLAFFFHL